MLETEIKKLNATMTRLIDLLEGQEAPVVLMQAEEVPAEEVPAEEVPAEEVPAEEVPAEEVPAAEELSVEEFKKRVTAVARATSKAEVRAVLQGDGYQTTNDVPAELRVAFLAKIEG